MPESPQYAPEETGCDKKKKKHAPFWSDPSLEASDSSIIDVNWFK
jgi:hypothetical protein